MIEFANSIKSAYPILFIILGLLCLIWGFRHLRRPLVKHQKRSIYFTPVKQVGIWKAMKAQIDYGWNAGRAAAEKRRQEKNK